ncbi:MAG: hypothetical protein ACYDEI_06735, partial [Erysipelotrichaceae bacterium]
KIKDILHMVELNIEFYQKNHSFEMYYEELKYLSAINCLNMLRKVPLMDDLDFVISFIDDTFKVLSKYFTDFPKSTYGLMNLPQASIYFNPLKLKLYVYYKYISRKLRMK